MCRAYAMASHERRSHSYSLQICHRSHSPLSDLTHPYSKPKYTIMATTSSKRLWNLYYHHFPFYMLTGPEGVFLHIFIVSFLSFVAYGLYSVLPTYVPFLISRSYYYLTGGDY